MIKGINNAENVNNDRCYNCNKVGHHRKYCPYLDKQLLPPNNDSSRKRKKAYTTTLDDSDSSSSVDEKKTDNSNLCFTAIHRSDDDGSMDLKIGKHLHFILIFLA